ncbi:hypothetical protein [Chelativorans salis]|uniref:J domain-containing protein n=1 Tax=Chelativorans salis TaxID=2978478 RepID=A0ABT2LNF8_9HYPH|nr:hypothetical protein [Chelativorans sp. EGI FJ00035]MCT7375208.1 hypothetical protein [Chelativorans sp. EGI FJ00035]
MGRRVPRDFASMLDELLAEHGREPDGAHLVSIDYLSVAEELNSGRISFSEDMIQAAYRMFADQGPAGDKAIAPEPSVDPDDIAHELGLGKQAKPKELDRLRRDFAFRNHPDRVPEHLRARAIIRMQVANMLIDEAKRGRFRWKKA